MTGRDLGHVITWDFLIFLLKDGYLIDKFMVFSDLRISRSYITARIPAQSARINIPNCDVTTSDIGKAEHSARRVSTEPFLVLSSNTSKRRSQLAPLTSTFKVKAVPKLKHAIRLTKLKHAIRLIMFFSKMIISTYSFQLLGIQIILNKS